MFMNTTAKEKEALSKDLHINTSGLSMETYVEVVAAQTSLNSKIISIMENETLAKEAKQQLIGLLSNNAENATTLLALIKQKHYSNMVEGLDEQKIAEIIPEDNSIGMIDKFKTMMASFKTDFAPNVFFKNMKQPKWKEMFEISLMKINPKFSKDQTISGVLNHINNSANELKVFVKQKNSDLYIIGQRHRIKKLKKKYENIFSLLKIDSSKFLDQEIFNLNNKDNDIKSTIDNYFKTKFGAETQNGKDYEFSILEGLNEPLQFEMLSKVLLKESVSQISNAHEMGFNLEQERNNNRYYKMVLDFSTSHQLNPQLVFHSLKNNSEIFNSYDDFSKVNKERENILNAHSNYSNLENKNNSYISGLLDITNSIIQKATSLNVDKELVSQMITDVNEIKISNGRSSVLLKELELIVKKVKNDIETTSEKKVAKRFKAD